MYSEDDKKILSMLKQIGGLENVRKVHIYRGVNPTSDKNVTVYVTDYGLGIPGRFEVEADGGLHTLYSRADKLQVALRGIAWDVFE